MATLSTQPRAKHSSTFWTLTICGLFVLALVIAFIVFVVVYPSFFDAVYIAWT